MIISIYLSFNDKNFLISFRINCKICTYVYRITSSYLKLYHMFVDPSDGHYCISYDFYFILIWSDMRRISIE